MHWLHRAVAPSASLDTGAALAAIDPARTPTAYTDESGAAGAQQAGPAAVHAARIVELLRRYDVPIAGSHVVVIGRGVTVGRPLGLMLTRKSENATVTLCHGDPDFGVFTAG